MRRNIRATLVKTFPATDDAGNRYTICYYKTCWEDEDTDGVETVEGDSFFRTSDGLDVKRLGKGEYQIEGGLFGTDIIVRSDSPDAV